MMPVFPQSYMTLKIHLCLILIYLFDNKVRNWRWRVGWQPPVHSVDALRACRLSLLRALVFRISGCRLRLLPRAPIDPLRSNLHNLDAGVNLVARRFLAAPMVTRFRLPRIEEPIGALHE